MYDRQNYHFIDLTHSLDERAPTWNGSCGFQLHTKLDYSDTPDHIRAQKVQCHAGIGTHMDAPAHFIQGSACIDGLDLVNLMVPLYVIKAEGRVAEDYVLSLVDVEAFEKTHQASFEGSFVLIHTGWDQYWNQPDRYRNNLKFPSVSAEAARYLSERGIVGLGVDTLSPDLPDTGFPVHNVLLSRGIYIVENVACAHKVPPKGAFVAILPMKIANATEAPVRMVAMVPK